MRTVIGIDPSMTSTGVAVWREGRIGTFRVPTSPADGHRVDRQRLIVGRILPLLGERVVQISHRATAQTVCLIEAVHQGKHKGRAALDLTGLHDVIVYGIRARHIPVGVVAPQHAKQVATGKGNAGKAQMVEACAEQLGLHVATADEADAAWFAAMGVMAGGGWVVPARAGRDKAGRWWPWPVPWEKARAEALRKIEWIGSVEPDWLKG